MLTIYAVSDATGKTAERLVQAALAQFAEAPVRLVRRGQVRTPERVRAVVQEARGQECLILHTLVSDELRRLMLAEARLQGVDSMDMMGPLLDRLSVHLKLTPMEKPGLFEQLVEAKSREIEAVSFAFRHDDGQNAQDLDRAELVLVGVSRTMKTPTMLYLAYRGWFTANVPLVPGLPLPDELLRFPAAKVFCLSMPAYALLELRRVRAMAESIPLECYAAMEPIRTELQHAEECCARYGWRRIDVVGKSVEEVGREIILLASGPSTDSPRT